MLSFKLPHYSVLWTFTPPKLVILNISDWAPQTVHANPAASHGSVWADYMQRLRTAAGLKIMILMYTKQHRSDFSYPQEKEILQVNSQILPRHFHMLFWPQFIFPAELYNRKWSDEKVATAYSWGDINKGTKLITIKWRQIPPDFTCWLPTKRHFFPSKEEKLCVALTRLSPLLLWGQVIWLLKLSLNIRKYYENKKRSNTGVKWYSWGQGQVSFFFFLPS